MEFLEVKYLPIVSRQNILQVLNSDDFFLMLSNWTGLKLHPNFEGDESDDEEDSEEEKREPTGGAQRCSIRKWKNGNYTLLHDADSKERASVDLFIHLLPKKRKGMARWRIVTCIDTGSNVT